MKIIDNLTAEERAELQAAQERARQRQVQGQTRSREPSTMGQLLTFPPRHGRPAAPPAPFEPSAWVKQRLGNAPTPPRQGLIWVPCVDCKEEDWHDVHEPMLSIEPNGWRCTGCLERRRQEREAQQHLLPAAEALATIPERYRGARLDAPELRERVPLAVGIEQARAFADMRQANVMLFLGATGRGKTTLATAVFWSHLERAMAPGATDADRSWARRALWVSARKLAMARRESSLGSEPALVERARNASLLLLDDLGQEAPADQGDVVAVLSDRQAEGRPTLVTFGFRLNDAANDVRDPMCMRTRYGAHLERRLTEHNVVIDLGGLS
jgi:DNA replication protein DnaC